MTPSRRIQLNDVTIDKHIMTHYVALEQFVTPIIWQSFQKNIRKYKKNELRIFILDEHLSIVNGYFKKRNYEWPNRKRIRSETDNE